MVLKAIGSLFLADIITINNRHLYKFAISVAKTVLQQKSSRPPVPISNATKRSFLGSPAAMSPADLPPSTQPLAEGSHWYHLHSEEPECLGKGSSTFSPSHPLLPLRQKQQKVSQTEEIPGETMILFPFLFLFMFYFSFSWLVK